MKEKLKNEIRDLEKKIEGYEQYGIKLLSEGQKMVYDKLQLKVKQKWVQLKRMEGNR